MNITKKMLVKEIKTLQKAAKIHAKYSINQYKKVLKSLEQLEEQKKHLEQQVKQRTIYLEKEIKQKEKLADKLENMAKYDQLTGLANRYLFLNELDLLENEANLTGNKFTILFIDLDGFKLVNDTYGHEIGDILLQTVSQRIKNCVRKSDTVARLGGDEFAVILKNTTNKKVIKKIAEKIIEEIKEVIKIEDLHIYIGSSIGIYTYTLGDTTQDILSKADIAMYESKKSGKGIYKFFDETMQKQLHEIAYLKNKIKHGIKKGDFINFFQPIVTSVNHEIVGAEILLRLKEKTSYLSPNKFIPLLEDDIHLIKEVTFWQIRNVVDLLKKTNIYYSINISGKLLNDYDLVDFLKKCLKKHNCDRSRIYFEVTESVISQNIVFAGNLLKEIKNLGFNISLDDFGTGYSSLAYLRTLPFDTLKIDKTFINNILKSDKDKKLLQCIINLANIFNMKIVLEGIETEEQLKILPSDKEIKYQGFLFYKPVEKSRFLNLLSFT